jgi:AraC-like DNA-binding protein
MSRSNLYRLLGNTGGLTRFIQIQRLLEARTLLSDRSIDKPIAAIAEELCFADASSFSRAFRREFGHSPSEIRSDAWASLAQSRMPMPGAMPLNLSLFFSADADRSRFLTPRPVTE